MGAVTALERVADLGSEEEGTGRAASGFTEIECVIAAGIYALDPDRGHDSVA